MSTPIQATEHGYVVRIDVNALEAEAAAAASEVEIVLRVSLGAFVAFQDVVAEVRAAPAGADLIEAVQAAVHVEQQRDLDTDPAHGIEQLAIIAWTSVSTAKSNPSPGLLVLRTLRDVLARWSADEAEGRVGDGAAEQSRVVYTDDVSIRLFDAFETVAVAASESMQPQTAAELFRTFTVMFHRLPAQQQERAEDLIRRSLSALGEHVPTAELDGALSNLVGAMRDVGRRDTAAEVEAAREKLGAAVGRLGSRGTRVTGGEGRGSWNGPITIVQREKEP